MTNGFRLASLLGGLLLVGCMTQTAEYASVEEARDDLLFTRGWLPDVLPAGEGPIFEVHDLDTNALCSRTELQRSGSAAEVSAGLLAAGFEEYKGALPESPLGRRCRMPGLADVASGTTLRRWREEVHHMEYAVVTESAFFLWSLRR